jgi:hypothetical protein
MLERLCTVVRLNPPASAGSFTLARYICASFGTPKGTLTWFHTLVARRTRIATLLLPEGQSRPGMLRVRERFVIR